jgi:arsenical-resistance protein 2
VPAPDTSNSLVLDRLICLGSSTGRGSRATSWLADHIADAGDKELQSLALAGGIKGWAAAGAEYVEWMDGYDAAVWAKSAEGC